MTTQYAINQRIRFRLPSGRMVTGIIDTIWPDELHVFVGCVWYYVKR